MAHKWKDIGLALRLHPDILNTIEADYEDSKSRLREVLTKWLKKSYDTAHYGQPTWKLLVAAVANPAGGDDRALAEQIAGRRNGKCNGVFTDISKSWQGVLGAPVFLSTSPTRTLLPLLSM